MQFLQNTLIELRFLIQCKRPSTEAFVVKPHINNSSILTDTVTIQLSSAKVNECLGLGALSRYGVRKGGRAGAMATSVGGVVMATMHTHHVVVHVAVDDMLLEIGRAHV